MGRLPSEDRKYQLLALNNNHHEILRYALLGYKPRQIADALGVTEPTVCNVLNGSKGRAQLAIMRGARDSKTIDVARDIAEFAPKCVEVLKEIIENDTNQPHLRGKYALEMLGIAGHVKPQRVQVQGSVHHLTSDDITAIKLRARQIAEQSGVLAIEGDYTELPQGESSTDQSSDLASDEVQNAR